VTRSYRRAGFLAVVAIAFGYYVAAAAAGPYWLDSSEFAAQAFGLGVSHPPGHPLYGLLGKLFALIPVGTVAFRVGLLSAACAALGAGLLYLVALELWDRVADDGLPAVVPVLVAAAAALAVALGYSYAFQAVRPEVYALHALVALLVLWAVLRHDATGERRWLYLAALVGALGLGNHHLLMLTVLVPALLVAVLRRPAPGWRRTAARVAVFAALGLLVWLYLPLRAARDPLVNWGDPRTPARFAWTVSAQAFAGKSVARARDAAYAGAATGMAALGARELGALAALAPIGLVLLAWRPRGRRAAALVAGAVALGAGAAGLVGFDAQNPDIHGYLAVPAGLAAASAAPALLLLLAAAARRGRAGRALATGASVALVAVAGVSGGAAFAAVDLRQARGCETMTRALLDAAPPRATLLTGYFQTAFGLWYARGVEGARPDVDHVHVTFLGFPGYAERTFARLPDLAWLGDVRGRETDAPALARLARRGPVVVEYDLSTPPGAVPLLALEGGAARVVTDAAARARALADAVVRQERFDGELRRRLGADRDEPQTARARLYRAFLELRFFCQSEGRGAAARAAFARAEALAPDDADLQDAARKCGLTPKGVSRSPVN
jgi:hypothetical protein